MPGDLTVGQFVYVIRKRIRVSPEKAIFMFVKNVLPPTGEQHALHLLTSLDPFCRRVSPEYPDFFHIPAAALMSEVYDDHKDEDGFLYITYSGENTFG